MKTFKKGMMIKAKTTVKKVSPSAKGLTAGKPSKQTAGKPPRSYKELLERVRETLARGRARAQKALEEIQTRMFWETGRWIHLYLKHEKKTPGRAPYGDKVIPKLANDLNHDKNYLYDALSVYRNNPIFPTLGKLTVSHHRALLEVKDAEARKTLAAEALKEGWTVRELAQRIRGQALQTDGGQAALTDGRKPAFAPGSYILRGRKGKLNHCRVVERDGRLFLDLGFRDFRELTGSNKGNLKNGDIVEGTSLDQLAAKPAATKADLYTYRAKVQHFPDADTYWLFIDKGFGGFRDDKIRLKGIDAPEIDTPEGRAARDFVESLLALPSAEKGKGPYRDVLIATTKTPDKWDRYLVDLYFE
ncbi:MAG: hypothetical protein A3A73_05180, partial [Omnitrophica bacterium RIFCSPLOWO2_01_FULL_50_24]